MVAKTSLTVFHGKGLGQTCHTVLFYYVSQHISWQGFGSDMSYIVPFYYVSQHISWQVFGSDMSYCTFLLCVTTYFMARVCFRHVTLYLSDMFHNIFHGKGLGQTCHILYLSIMCHNIFHGKGLGQTCHTVPFYYVSQHISWKGFGSDMSYCTFLLCVTTYFMARVWVRHVILYFSIMCHNIFHGKCLGQTCHTVPFYYVSQHISWQVFGSDMSYCTFLLCVTTYFMASVWVRHVILYFSIMCHNIFHGKGLGQTCHILYLSIMCHNIFHGKGLCQTCHTVPLL